MIDMNDEFRAIAPPIKRMEAIAIPEVETLGLPSGAMLHTYNNTDNDFSHITVLTPGGQAESRTPGISALRSMMMREGTADYSGEEIAAILDYNGAWIKNGVHPHHTLTGMFSLNSRLEKVLPAMVSLTMRADFPEEALKVRRDMLAQNIAVAMEDVSFIAGCDSDCLIMGASHPLAAIDTPQSISEITRHDLLRFNDAFTATEGMHIFLCGNITTDIRAMVTEAFATLPHRSGKPMLISPFEAAPAGSEERKRKPGAAQSSMMLTLPAIGRSHPDYLPLHLTVAALGGYFGSRLMTNIREEKGLTYGISASLMGYIDGAYIQISADTDNRHVDSLIREVRHELRRMASEPPRGEELERLRQHALSAQATTLDSPLSIIDHYVTAVVSGMPDGYFNARQKTIEALTSEKLAEMAERYLMVDNLRTAIAGD